MRTLVLATCAIIALGSCMQQNNAADAEKTPQSVTTQTKTAQTEVPATVETTQPVVEANTPVKHAQSLKELNLLIQKMGTKPKTYTVSSTKTSRIKGDKGSILEVDPKALENVDGTPVTGNIVVEFAEYTSAKDLLFAGAPTVSDGKLLVSAGSYYVSATNNGKAMRVKNGKDLKLSVAEVKDKEMDIFYGEKDANGLINWKWDSDIFKEGTAGKTPVSIGTEALSDAKPKLTDAKFNCFNIIYDGKNYAVITVGNTVKIKQAETNSQIQFIYNTTLPPTTLCVRGFSERSFRTYKTDTTRKGKFVEYIVTDGQSKDATDIDYIKALKSTSIKVPDYSLVTRVVPEKYLSDTLLTIKAAAVKKQEAEAKKRNWKDTSTGDWSGFNIGDVMTGRKVIKVDSVKNEASKDVNTLLRVKKLGWVNCDRFPRMSTKPMIARYNPNEFDLVSGILVFRKQLVVLYANYAEDGGLGFQSVPVNEDGVLITYASINNKLYGQIQPIRSEATQIRLDLKPMDNKAFKNLLEASIK